MVSKVKKVFPGGNTSLGFFSYYDYLIEKDANRIFVIKGGPGVGKSSLMKKIATFMIDRGYDVEFHYCSSDNNSLDGVVIPKLKIALVDGTAPHIVDPKNPGGVDEIINLGEFWDIEKMKNNKDDILKSNAEVGRLFARAYKFLGCSKNMIDDIIVKYKESMNFSMLNTIYLELIGEILSNVNKVNEYAKERHLFSSAITPLGYVDFSKNILESMERVYYLSGDIVNGKSTMMKKIAQMAVDKGLDVEIYHTPLIPNKIQTIVIKDINVGITSSDLCKDISYKTIDLSRALNKDILQKYRDEIDEDLKLFEEFINYGVENIARSKKEHDVLETYYVPNIDFDKVEEKKNDIINLILSYENN